MYPASSCGLLSQDESWNNSCLADWCALLFPLFVLGSLGATLVAARNKIGGLYPIESGQSSSKRDGELNYFSKMNCEVGNCVADSPLVGVLPTGKIESWSLLGVIP